MIGQTLGHYRIEAKLGEGGMGVVYRARDTHLDRPVAIKVLSSGAVSHPERQMRFVQEAKAASALNHPNITHVYDIDIADGINFIAMEYVGGQTLDEVIGRKGLKVSEALKYAIQIADGLGAAHAAGIVHRDVKPTNIMVSGGLIKILDFGLAKLTDAPLSDDASTQTQIMRPRTEEGTIVGTVAYMSPEQAEGRKLDARSDIFSFGSVLYEMVTGRRAFAGPNKISVLSAILHKEPEPARDIVEGLPEELEKIISRCIRKDPERRIQHMGDVKLALQDLKEESESGRLVSGVVPVPRSVRRRRYAWIAVALLLCSAGAYYALRPAATAALRTIPFTSYPTREIFPAFSPDGNQIAFAWDGDQGDNFDIYVKLVGAGTPLRLTTSPATEWSPAFSPDGNYIAFLRAARSDCGFFLIPALGGPERKLASATDQLSSERTRSLGWTPDGKHLLVADKISRDDPFSIFLLSIDKAEKRKLTTPPKESIGDRDPAVSPDGRMLAFSRSTSDGVRDLYLVPLAGGTPKQLTFDRARIVGIAWMPGSREIIFSSPRGGTTYNLWRVAVSGGTPKSLLGTGVNGIYPTTPLRGQRLAYTEYYADTNIWKVDLAGGPKMAAPEKLIASTRNDFGPQYSPDGSRIAFMSDRSGSYEIWVADSQGANIVQLTSFGGPMTDSPHWSPDGKRIVFNSRPQGHSDVFVVSAEGGAPVRLTSGAAEYKQPSWSADGAWIYFAAPASGEMQVWKIAANGAGYPVQLTRNGGFSPLSSPDGKFVYYIKPSKGAWKIPVDGGSEVAVTPTVKDALWGYWAVTSRGIYYVDATRREKTENWGVFLYRPDQGGAAQIANLDHGPYAFNPGFSISPDGRSALVASLDRVAMDIMLVENFR